MSTEVDCLSYSEFRAPAGLLFAVVCATVRLMLPRQATHNDALEVVVIHKQKGKYWGRIGYAQREVVGDHLNRDMYYLFQTRALKDKVTQTVNTVHHTAHRAQTVRSMVAHRAQTVRSMVAHRAQTVWSMLAHRAQTV